MPDVSKVGSARLALYAVEALAANAKTFPSRASEYGPGFRAALEIGQRRWRTAAKLLGTRHL